MILPLLFLLMQTPQAAERLWQQKQYKEANDAFRQAVANDQKNAALRVRWGLLLLERFNPKEATDLFTEALAIEKDYPPALLGLAKVFAEGFDRRAVDFAKQAMEKDPKLTEARELYANLLLEDGNFEDAAKEAQQIPQSPSANATLAAIELLKDRPATAYLAKIENYSEGHARIARHFFLNRRYTEAIAHYRKAIAIDPANLAAQSNLAINLMRVGEDVEARQLLEAAFKAGYTNAATANSLTLIDSYKNFVTYKQPRFILRLHKSEAELLKPYVEREMARALQTYDRKYGFELKGPVTVEMYPDHEDFAVRTMGMPGLGALGVTFGMSIAMDSPSGRKPGSFHWASTLWHELSHVYVLSATNHRTPRWFTEGVAVHEETAASPEWGDRLSPEIVAAMQKKLLLPIATLDRGYMRPAYPSQVIVSYFQGGRTIDYIVSRWGWPKVLEMERAFSRVTTTAEVVESVLKLKPEDFDKQFLEWLTAQHKTALDNFESWSKDMKPMNAAVKAKQWDEVLKLAPRLRDEYPEYVEAGNQYEALAAVYLAKGDKAKAIAELDRYARIGGRDPAVLKKLSALQEEAGNPKAAEEALARLLYIYPTKDEELHRKLAALRGSLSRWEGAAEEWRAVIAMKTVDPASANYELARAYKELRRLDDARDAVLAALEAAPGYRPAQKLLLELNRKENNE